MDKKNGFMEVIISLCFLVLLMFMFLQKDVDTDYTNILVIVSISIAALTVCLSLLKFIKNSTFNRQSELKEIELDLTKYSMMREHLEHEISQLQKKLVNTEQDWEMVNHLPLSAQKKEYDNETVQISNFIKRFGLTEKDICIDRKMVFLLTPFSEENVEFYKETKNICLECGLNLYRGDEEFTNKDILANIIKFIVKSRVIIANIDGKNPNVFYELGIAHALSKPTIIISKAIKNAPFDIQQNRIVLYDDYDDLKIKLSRELSRILVDH